MGGMIERSSLLKHTFHVRYVTRDETGDVSVEVGGSSKHVSVGRESLSK